VNKWTAELGYKRAGWGVTPFFPHVESGALKSGRIYRPKVTVHTDAGIMRPELPFKKSLPWFIINAAVIAVAIAIMVMMR